MKIEKINKILIFLFLIFLPTQFGKHYFFDFSYIFGVRVDYLALTIYATDILVFLLALLNLKILIPQLKKKGLFILLVFIIINIFFSQLKIIALFRWIKILEFLIIFYIFSRKKIQEKIYLHAFLISGAVELFLSLAQLFSRHSLQGIFYYFGERLFTLSTPGIAKTAVNGVEILRPYATFSHPNSLAGFYLLIYFFVLIKISNQYLIRKNILLLVSSLLVLLSFSKTAILAYLILNTLYFILKKNNCRFCTATKFLTALAVSLVFITAKNDPLSLGKRLELITNASKIICSNLLFGVGLGSYINAQKNYISSYYLFINQPVHNIFLLLISELGIITGLYLAYHFILYTKSLPKHYWIIIMVIVFTGMFDHYWLTLQQNLLLAGVLLGSIEAPSILRSGNLSNVLRRS